MWSLKRWLARLSFSLLILAGLLIYSGWKGAQIDGWTARHILMIVASVPLALLGMVGIRVRHSGELFDDPPVQ